MKILGHRASGHVLQRKRDSHPAPGTPRLTPCSVTAPHPWGARGLPPRSPHAAAEAPAACPWAGGQPQGRGAGGPGGDVLARTAPSGRVPPSRPGVSALCPQTKTGAALLHDEASGIAYDIRLTLTKEVLTIQKQDVICVSGSNPGANVSATASQAPGLPAVPPADRRRPLDLGVRPQHLPTVRGLPQATAVRFGGSGLFAEGEAPALVQTPSATGFDCHKTKCHLSLTLSLTLSFPLSTHSRGGALRETRPHIP